jgi:hypothetical protein
LHFVPQYLYPMLLILFILYRRIKRSIGFQPFKTRRLIVRIAIFSFIAVLLLGISALHPMSYIYDLAGIIAGLILITYAIKHSSFEMREKTLFYRTHIWIESFVLFVFLGRFLYRVTYLFVIPNSQPNMNSVQYGQHFTKDPSTMAIFFLLAAYYIGFYSFVLKKGKEILYKNQTNHQSVTDITSK